MTLIQQTNNFLNRPNMVGKLPACMAGERGECDGFERNCKTRNGGVDMFKKKVLSVLDVFDPEKNVSRLKKEVDLAWAKCIDLQRQSDEAMSAAALAEQTAGLSLAEGVEVDSSSLNAAKDRAVLLRLALDQATKKRDEAQRLLNQAEAEARMVAEEKAILDLRRTCERIDGVLSALETSIQELARSIETAKNASASNR